jgi:hypothetical protein
MINVKSTELHINNPNPPIWDPRKHYWEQSRDTIQYFEEERRKIVSGLNIGGYFVHPLLYWHINYFKTAIPTPIKGRPGHVHNVVRTPVLDDNTMYIIDNYRDAEAQSKGMILFGSRGFLKTTFLSSLMHWLTLTNEDSTCSVVGGSSDDLETLATTIQTSLDAIHPAFHIPRITTDWSSEVVFGIKEKSQKPLVHSRIAITNADPDKKSKSESGAGRNPSGFIIDEALCENSDIETPNGLVKMKDLQVGDFVIGEDGKNTEIYSKINPGVVDTYEFVFDNGVRVISSKNHRWKASTTPDRETFDTVTSRIISIYEKDIDLYFPTLNGKPTRLIDIMYAGKRQVYCIGVKNESETFVVGGGVVTKNCGKFDFQKVWESALPSFETPHGYRLVPLLSGTGGNASLSKYAKKVLHSPESYGLIPVNWELLERGVPKEAITWERSKKGKFGTFVPGQMSYRLEGDKLDSNLSDYLGIKDSTLKGIPLKVTDWMKKKELIEGRINDKKRDEDERNKTRMYYPLETADCFLTQSINPFPTKIIDRHIRYLEDMGKLGKNVEIIMDGSTPTISFSEKHRAEIHHKGGNVDAPLILHGDLPLTPPSKYLNVAGFDGYKLEDSDTDSLGSLYVLRRRHMEANSPCETILCSYTSRPNRMKDFHKECERIIEVFNSQCCMESVDMGLMQYLDQKGKADDLLAPAFTFSNSAGANTNLRSRFGLYPTKANNEFRFNLLVEFTKEEHTVGIDDQGNEIIKYGVEFIDDIDLLKEMLNYYKGGNFDRITAFSHALVYARELDKASMQPVQKKKLSDMMNQPKKVVQARNPYGNIRHKKY